MTVYSYFLLLKHTPSSPGLYNSSGALFRNNINYTELETAPAVSAVPLIDFILYIYKCYLLGQLLNVES